MPKILKNKKVKRIFSKRKLKSKNLRKSNIRSRKLLLKRKTRKGKRNFRDKMKLRSKKLRGGATEVARQLHESKFLGPAAAPYARPFTFVPGSTSSKGLVPYQGPTQNATQAFVQGKIPEENNTNDYQFERDHNEYRYPLIEAKLNELYGISDVIPRPIKEPDAKLLKSYGVYLSYLKKENEKKKKAKKAKKDEIDKITKNFDRLGKVEDSIPIVIIKSEYGDFSIYDVDELEEVFPEKMDEILEYKGPYYSFLETKRNITFGGYLNGCRKTKKNKKKKQKKKFITLKKQKGGTSNVGDYCEMLHIIKVESITLNFSIPPSFGDPTGTQSPSSASNNNIFNHIEKLNVLFFTLGKGIYDEDILIDYIHDFIEKKSPEDDSLKKEFNGYMKEAYEKYMRFIPLDLKSKTNRKYWERHGNTEIKDLSESIQESISVVDAGAFKPVRGFGKQKIREIEISAHLSNIIDPAQTGKSHIDYPYLLYNCLKNIFTSKDGVSDNFLNNFMIFLNNFIYGIADGKKNGGEIRKKTIRNISKIDFAWEGKELKITFDGRSQLLENSQAALATAINDKLKSSKSDDQEEITKPRSNKKMNKKLEELIQSICGPETNQEKIIDFYKNSKYMGDKSHIVQAILYILLFKKKVIIKTLDRLLFKCVCQIIIKAEKLSETDDLLKDVYKIISENLGVMYGHNFSVARVMKEDIQKGQKYVQYNYEMIQKWKEAKNDIDDLGCYGLFSKFGDRFKSIYSQIFDLYKQFTQLIFDGVLKEKKSVSRAILESLIKKNNILKYETKFFMSDNFKINFTFKQYYDQEIGQDSQNIVIPVIYLGTLKNLHLFGKYPEESSYIPIKADYEGDFTEYISEENEFEKIFNNNKKVVNETYNQLVGQLRRLKTGQTYQIFIEYKLRLTFWEQFELLITTKYLKSSPFMFDEITKIFGCFIPGKGNGDIKQQLVEEIESGERGIYGIHDNKNISRPTQKTLASKIFPIFKTYLKNKNFLVLKDPYQKDEGLVFSGHSDIRDAKDPSIFRKMSFINNILSELRFHYFFHDMEKQIKKYYKNFIDFTENYRKKLRNFVLYYEKIAKYLYLPNTFCFTISGDLETKYEVELKEYFKVCYGDFSDIFSEYIVEAYLLNIPLIYFMKFNDEKDLFVEGKKINIKTKKKETPPTKTGKKRPISNEGNESNETNRSRKTKTFINTTTNTTRQKRRIPESNETSGRPTQKKKPSSAISAITTTNKKRKRNGTGDVSGKRSRIEDDRKKAEEFLISNYCLKKEKNNKYYLHDLLPLIIAKNNGEDTFILENFVNSIRKGGLPKIYHRSNKDNKKKQTQANSQTSFPTPPAAPAAPAGPARIVFEGAFGRKKSKAQNPPNNPHDPKARKADIPILGASRKKATDNYKKDTLVLKVDKKEILFPRYQVLYLSNNDYDRQLFNVLKSIRELYQQSKSVLKTFRDYQKQTNPQANSADKSANNATKAAGDAAKFVATGAAASSGDSKKARIYFNNAKRNALTAKTYANKALNYSSFVGSGDDNESYASRTHEAAFIASRAALAAKKEADKVISELSRGVQPTLTSPRIGKRKMDNNKSKYTGTLANSRPTWALTLEPYQSTQNPKKVRINDPIPNP